MTEAIVSKSEAFTTTETEIKPTEEETTGPQVFLAEDATSEAEIAMEAPSSSEIEISTEQPPMTEAMVSQYEAFPTTETEIKPTEKETTGPQVFLAENTTSEVEIAMEAPSSSEVEISTEQLPMTEAIQSQSEVFSTTEADIKPPETETIGSQVVSVKEGLEVSFPSQETIVNLGKTETQMCVEERDFLKRELKSQGMPENIWIQPESGKTRVIIDIEARTTRTPETDSVDDLMAGPMNDWESRTETETALDMDEAPIRIRASTLESQTIESYLTENMIPSENCSESTFTRLRARTPESGTITFPDTETARFHMRSAHPRPTWVPSCGAAFPIRHRSEKHSRGWTAGPLLEAISMRTILEQRQNSSPAKYRECRRKRRRRRDVPTVPWDTMRMEPRAISSREQFHGRSSASSGVVQGAPFDPIDTPLSHHTAGLLTRPRFKRPKQRPPAFLSRHPPSH
eukprot:Gregarina_sp_Poly_1__5409@NODE_285_length_10045_cov_61_806174_g246_i0_p2_GENE_NODE_285_length_10045_cov_61_806174_g246_i0NODE_285_length_10045_cov_61_806174_g246_i0_p2_ORF_typecomplete_len516_score100_00_NODE_285_length_10045_cov_61_806174_g246_i01751548